VEFKRGRSIVPRGGGKGIVSSVVLEKWISSGDEENAALGSGSAADAAENPAEKKVT